VGSDPGRAIDLMPDQNACAEFAENCVIESARRAG